MLQKLSIQKQLNKAFQYACLNSLFWHTSAKQKVVVLQTNALTTAILAYEALGRNIQLEMDFYASDAIKRMAYLETLFNAPWNDQQLLLSIQGKRDMGPGDLRNIICKRDQWEIGIHCNYNSPDISLLSPHHFSLSENFDFGLIWFGLPCSLEYFNVIRPLFNELNGMKFNKILWQNVRDKETRFYIPILQAFINELQRLNNVYPDELPAKLFRFLIGTKDYYNIVTLIDARIPLLQPFNFRKSHYRTGIRPSRGLPKIKEPARIIDIHLVQDSADAIRILFYQWSILLQVDNRSSVVDPNLTFDVKLEGVPVPFAPNIGCLHDDENI